MQSLWKLGEHYRAGDPAGASGRDGENINADEGNVSIEPVGDDDDEDEDQTTSGAFARLR